MLLRVNIACRHRKNGDSDKKAARYIFICFLFYCCAIASIWKYIYTINAPKPAMQLNSPKIHNKTCPLITRFVIKEKTKPIIAKTGTHKIKNIRIVILLYVPHKNNAKERSEVIPMPRGLYINFETSELADLFTTSC